MDRCTFDESASRLDIHLDFPRGSVFCCPVCGMNCKAYDTDYLTWRHLNFFQHQTFPDGHDPNSFFVGGGDAQQFQRLLENALP